MIIYDKSYKSYIRQRRILNFQSQQCRTLQIAPFITKGLTGMEAISLVSDGLINPVNMLVCIHNKISYLESANYNSHEVKSGNYSQYNVQLGPLPQHIFGLL